jgi:multiple sugar transport system substrate-binding protein
MGSGMRGVGCVLAAVLTASAAVSGCADDDGGAAGLVDEEETESTEPTEPSPTGSPSPTGPVRLTWYAVPDTQADGGLGQIAAECVAASDGRYVIEVERLPVEVATQRARLETSLAADLPVDLVSVDQTFLGDFAAAGHLAPLPAADQQRLRDLTLAGPLAANTINGRMMAFPLFTNTQLLWYRKSEARRAKLDLRRPVTWDRLIGAAAPTSRIEVQASRYEGYVVWLNALVAGAGGQLLRIDSQPGRAAARIVRDLATSKAADPAIDSTTEFETHERFFGGRAGFMVNWSYVWSLRDTARWKRDDLGWAMYPRTTPDRPARPPIGGVGLAVPASSEHRELAFEAARCITSREHQVRYMLTQHVLTGLASAYDDPRVRRAYPMADLIRDSLRVGAPRPPVANYDEVSQALQETFWPPRRVNPTSTPRAAQRALDRALR